MVHIQQIKYYKFSGKILAKSLDYMSSCQLFLAVTSVSSMFMFSQCWVSSNILMVQGRLLLHCINTLCLTSLHSGTLDLALQVPVGKTGKSSFHCVYIFSIPPHTQLSPITSKWQPNAYCLKWKKQTNK